MQLVVLGEGICIDLGQDMLLTIRPSPEHVFTTELSMGPLPQLALRRHVAEEPEIREPGRPASRETMLLRRTLEEDARLGRLKPSREYISWFARVAGVPRSVAGQRVRREHGRVVAIEV